MDHVVLMVSNVKATEHFYSAFLGKPIHRDRYSVAYQIGRTKIFMGLPYHKIRNNSFNKDRVGLNHLAFGTRSLAELRSTKNVLDKNGIKNSGIKIDKYSKKEFVWFDDPDGIRMEFYVRKE